MKKIYFKEKLHSVFDQGKMLVFIGVRKKHGYYCEFKQITSLKTLRRYHVKEASNLEVIKKLDGGTADVFLVSKTDIIELKEGVNTLPVGKWRVRMITEKASGIVVLKK
jgi:hypothetical protein